MLKEGDLVTLYLSAGPEIIYHTMISCVGQSMEWVQMQMEKLNLVPVFNAVEDSAAVGTVLTQSIDTGTEVAEGTTVTFEFSDGEKLLEQVITFMLQYYDSPVANVVVYLDNTVVFESELPGNYGQVSVPVYAKAGTYQLRIYVNDLIWEERTVTFQ